VISTREKFINATYPTINKQVKNMKTINAEQQPFRDNLVSISIGLWIKASPKLWSWWRWMLMILY